MKAHYLFLLTVLPYSFRTKMHRSNVPIQGRITIEEGRPEG
jgi:hypothetical protein